MGREWSWSGRSTTTRRTEREATSGCMSAVLQLFDFHQFQFPLQQPCFKTPQSFLQEDPEILKGTEAPRNSLESEEGPCMETMPLSSSIMKESDLNLPMEIRLGTKVDNAKRGVTKGCMEEISSETSDSPATKTPNLVARLMGLDLLPDSSSPSFSSSKRSRVKRHQDHQLEEKIACAAVKGDLRSRRILHCRSNSNIMNFMENEVKYEMSGSRSLPDTPRISSVRRSADADPRLSLQINKENLIMIPPEEFASRNSFSYSPYSAKSRKKERRQGDENRSPRHYARQIVKQVKETVGRRKMGLDITNITRNGANEGDSSTIKTQKTRRLSLTKIGDESSPSKLSTPSCSPRLRFLEHKNKPVTATSTSNDKATQSPRPSSSSQPTPTPPQPSPSTFADNRPQAKAPRKPKAQASNQQATTKCRKGSSSSERFTQRLTKPPQTSETVRNMREEAFIRASPATKANLSDKKCKKTSISSELVNIAVPLNKEQKDSSATQKPVAQGSKRSSQLSSCLSRKYNKQEATEALAPQDGNNGSGNGGDAEFRYVSGILRSTGMYRDAFVSITRRCHPLNPLIFHHLEHFFPRFKVGDEEDDDDDDDRGGGVDLGQLRHRCNRKLLFQLVDEIMVDVLRPYLNVKPWLPWIDRGLLPVSIRKDTQMTGEQLLDRLWSRIQSFPDANCQILEDIDALVEKDLPQANMRTLLPYSEEAESIVFEIGRDILDSLLHETAAAFVFVD